MFYPTKYQPILIPGQQPSNQPLLVLSHFVNYVALGDCSDRLILIWMSLHWRYIKTWCFSSRQTVPFYHLGETQRLCSVSNNLRMTKGQKHILGVVLMFCLQTPIKNLSVCMITPGQHTFHSWSLSFVIFCVLAHQENLEGGTKLSDKYFQDISWSGATSHYHLDQVCVTLRGP